MRNYLYMGYNLIAQETQLDSVLDTFAHNETIYYSINLTSSLGQHIYNWDYSVQIFYLGDGIEGSSLPISETTNEGTQVEFNNPLFIVFDNNTKNDHPIYTHI